MLVKLRISNESYFVESMENPKFSIEEQYLQMYKELINSLKEGGIPKVLCPDYKDWGSAIFDFNGFDSKTNTYYYEYTTAVS